MNLSHADGVALSTAKLIQECRASVRHSLLARSQMAVTLSETLEQLTLLRHTAHALRLEVRRCTAGSNARL